MYDRFHKNVAVAMSDISDGSMKEVKNRGQVVRANAATFLQSNGFSIEKTVRISLDYDSTNFARYITVNDTNGGDGMTRSSSIVSDALFTRDINLALFLPLADCIGTILYDPDQNVLGVSHLGRHNLEQMGGEKTIRYMIDEFGSQSARLRVFMTAAAGKSGYPLHSFEGRSLKEVAVEQMVRAGVNPHNITDDARDTISDDSLYSHSNSLQDPNAPVGRQAVVAMMRS